MPKLSLRGLVGSQSHVFLVWGFVELQVSSWFELNIPTGALPGMRVPMIETDSDGWTLKPDGS